LGATERRVELPPGCWFPLLGGPAREGGVAMVAAPLEEIPAFVPAGALLVLLPDDVDTVVSSSSARTIADAGDDREICSPHLPVGRRRSRRRAGERDLERRAGRRRRPRRGRPGVLAMDGATLRVEGGRADRVLRVRFPSSRAGAL
jgi:hypothetical protein